MRHPEARLEDPGLDLGGTTVRVATASARLLAVGALSTAAVLGPVAGAFAADYAPTPPTPSASTVPPATATPRASVTPVAAAAATEELAYTGADVLPWATAGAVLVAGGAALVVAGRRRPAREH